MQLQSTLPNSSILKTAMKISLQGNAEVDRESKKIVLFRETKIKAETGDASLQFLLAKMYQYGSGVGKDENTAVEWYRKAADQGLADAQYALGLMYEYGSGVAKDENTAVEWYRKAADQGLAAAQYALGVMYQYGSGVGKDENTAVEWYRKAADQGLASAQYALGVMYQGGSGVAKDENTAVEWYRKAADQGLADAQYALGLMYEYGSGVGKDENTAVEWYRKAADQGLADAQNKLNNLRILHDLADADAQYNLRRSHDESVREHSEGFREGPKILFGLSEKYYLTHLFFGSFYALVFFANNTKDLGMAIIAICLLFLYPFSLTYYYKLLGKVIGDDKYYFFGKYAEVVGYFKIITYSLFYIFGFILGPMYIISRLPTQNEE